MRIIDSFKNNKLHLFLIIFLSAITFLVYLNSLEGEFQLDDNHTILDSPRIQNFDHFTKYKTWKRPVFNRSLAYLSYAINYHIHGYDVFGYHLCNVFIHIINSILVFYFIKLLFNLYTIRNVINDQKKIWIAFFTALIFALHPVQTQVVAYITQRMVSLSILFYLIALCSYIKLRLNILGKNSIAKTILFAFAICISFLLGNYSKEIMMSLPVAVLLVEYLFIRRDDGSRDYKFLIIPLLLIATAAYYVLTVKGFPKQPNALPRNEYFLTELNVLMTYIRLMILPVNLQVYYDYQTSKSLFELTTLLSSITLLCLLFIGVFLRNKQPIISFAIFWFFITLFIESSIFPLQHVIFEYRIYATLIGFGLILSYSVFTFIKIKSIYATLLLGTIAVVLSILTFNQNKVWQTNIGLWTDNIKKAPNHYIPYNFLGFYYMKQNNYQEALELFNKSLKINPNYVDALNHRGIIYAEQNIMDEAIKDLSWAIRVDSNRALSYNNLGYAYNKLKKFEIAMTYFEKAIKLERNYHSAIQNLSISYQKLNRFEEALKFAYQSLSFRPSDPNYSNNLGNVYFGLNKIDSAVIFYENALKINPHHERALYNKGTTYLTLENYDSALVYFNKVIKINRTHYDSFFNRALTLFNKKEYKLALQDIYSCISIDRQNNRAHLLADQIYTQLENQNN